jgi:C4-dicarboxylate-specific signal transduction histidine kinase
VIARIRAFVRRSDTQRASIDLQEVLRDVAAIVENEARTRGVALHIEIGAWPAPVIGDRVQLQQVVLHLVINAIEAMATTPVERRRLVIRLDRDGPDTMRVSVRDAGLGLPAQDRDRVFEAFYTTKDNGMGMGLAISRSIIEAHEGRLWCAPNDEGGESFCFTLPT